MKKEKTTYKIIDDAVKKRFKKPRRVLGNLFSNPTVTEGNRPLVVDPLVEAVESDRETGIKLDDVLYAIKLLHPDYMFTTSASTILRIAVMLAQGSRGEFPLGDGCFTDVVHYLRALNVIEYSSSKEYYQAVENLAKRRI